MNNRRRVDVINALKNIYEALRVLEIAKDMFGDIADEEYTSIENLSEFFAGSEKEQSMQVSYDALENACEVIEEAFDNLMDLTTEVEEACGIL